MRYLLIGALLTVALGSHAFGQGQDGGSIAACGQPSRSPTRHFCSSAGYLELITPYIQSVWFPRPAEEPSWQAAMARFVKSVTSSWPPKGWTRRFSTR